VAAAASIAASASGQAKTAAGAALVIGQLKAAGLPIDAVTAYSAADDPNHLLGRPGQYISKAMFHDSRLDVGTEVGNGGSVETFANADDLQNRAKYVQAIARSSALFSEYDYSAGRTLLRVSSKLTPDQAAAYEKAFQGAAQ